MDRKKLITRGISLAVCATLVIGGLVVSAHADNAISRALHDRKVTVKKLEILHDFRRVGRQNLHHQIRNIQARIVKVRANGPALASDRLRFTRTRSTWRSSAARCASVCTSWSTTSATVRSCCGASGWTSRRGSRPTASSATARSAGRLPGPRSVDVTNNFGYAVPHRPGVPAHIHQGNDMMAGSGQPIVAPFDGIAEASHNWLGGNAVYVRGANGYVYNAHLSAYGKLGAVKAGDVIGYVGSTGDAGGPHDHFEWHPGNGSAVDPYPYLMAVC